MNFGSKQCWMKPSKRSNQQPQSESLSSSNNAQQQQQQQQQQPQGFMFQNRYHNQIQEQDNNFDTNIVTIGFDQLTEAEKQLQMGDPIFCKGCKAVLSKVSKLVENKKDSVDKKDEKVEEEESKDNNKENKEQQEQPQVEEHGNMIWNCEFCQARNVLNIELEEIPQQEEVIYMVQSVNVNKIQDNSSNFEEEQTVIFVIDVSGSMSVTAPIKNKETNKFKHSTMVSSEEFEMLKQFMDEEDIYQYTQMQSQQNFVSRKQCVLAAIQQQMEDLANNQPNKKVGLIIFNNEVTIYGSGSTEPIVIAGDKLYRAEEIFEIASNCSKQLFNLPVKQAKNRLIEIFDNIKEKGQTALGPAIVAALGVLSKQKRGSQIIVCTDGLANVGVGSFEETDKNSFVDFYEDVKVKATDNDVIFNIISIKGEGCKLDILGSIADKTGGNVIRVDPDNLHKDFANILQDEVVALKAEMTIYLKNIMKFRNTDPEVDKVTENGSKCVKFIGNATKKTVATFEYTNKTDEEIIQHNLQDYDEKLKEMPFQSQIFYFNLQGHKMLRVLTRNQEITFDKKEAEKNLNYQVINTRVTTHTAQLIQNNNFSQARMFNKGWENYVSTNEEVEQDKRQEFKSKNAMLKNVARKKQTTQKASLESYGNYQQQQQRSSTSVNFQPPPPQQMNQMYNFNAPVQFAQQPPSSSLFGCSSSSSNSGQLFQTGHFGDNKFEEDMRCEEKQSTAQFKPLVQQPQSNDLCPIVEKPKFDCDDEEMFSGDDEHEEADEIEAYMYQQKNNKF